MLRKRFIVLFILFFSFPGWASDQYVPGQIFVKFKQDTITITGTDGQGIQSIDKASIRSNSIKELNAKNKIFKIKTFSDKTKKTKKIRSGKIVELPDLSQLVLLEFPKEIDVYSIIEEYRKDPSVEFASPNYIRHIFTPDDPYYITGPSPDNSQNQWGLYKIWLASVESVASGWSIEKGTSEVKVAVIDTGVNFNHDDLKGRVNSLEGYDFVNNDNVALDDHGHGTHCSGIIGAKTDNATGIAGVDWNCKIIPIKAFDSGGGGSDDDVISAIQWAVSKDADVISMSFGGTDNNPAVEAMISYAATSDCVLVAAAGNSNVSTKSYPAAYEKVISVAATGPYDEKASYTNYGSWVDVSAPGGNNGSGASYYLHYILSTYPFDQFHNPSNTSYAWLAGTSMATPFVAGLAALIRAKYKTMTAESVVQKIIDYSDNIDAYNIAYAGALGKGRINAYAALGGLYGYISYPANGGITYGIINIKGNSTGEGFNHYDLEYGMGTDPATWVTIESNVTTPKLNATLGTVDLTGKDDYVTLKLTENDLATTETRITFHAGSFDLPIIQGKAEYGPNPFNPNSDQIMIKYDLTRNSDTYIYFFDITGNLLCRKFYSFGTSGGSQGTNRVYWDGKTDFGETVANGVYLFRIASEGRTIGKGKIIVLK
jgi:thermitase